MLRIVTTLPLLLMLHTSAPAAIESSFDVSANAWNATQAVVVREGLERDGHVEVVRVWWGDLRPGQRLHVPALAEFAPVASRRVASFFNLDPPRVVSGQRLVVFLREDPQGAWKPAASEGQGVSTLWLESGRAFGRVQRRNPGPARLTDLGDSATLEERAQRVHAARARYDEALAVVDPGRRAELLGALLDTPASFGALCQALKRCGPAAVPILQRRLDDVSLDARPTVSLLLDLAGEAAEPALLRALGREILHWEQLAPHLPTLPDRGASHAPRLERVVSLLETLTALGTTRAQAQVATFLTRARHLEDLDAFAPLLRACERLLADVGKTSVIR